MVDKDAENPQGPSSSQKDQEPDPKASKPGSKDGGSGSKDGQSGLKDSKAQRKPVDLDDILVNELGQFGRFQIRNMLLVAIPLIISGFLSEYVFSAGAIPHRCQIPECGESKKDHPFEPKWVLNAIPATSGGSGFSSCKRFVAKGDAKGTLDECPASLFTSDTVECGGFVYARDNTVVYTFDLGCQDWLRALAGTLSSIGYLLSLPLVGFVSDKFGRKIALVVSVLNLSLIGTIRAFSVNYSMYLALQMLQSLLGAGTFSSAYIFATELVGPKFRVFTSANTGTLFAVGLITLGFVAWAVQYWRYMILTLHIPCFLLISYYWILPESVRWLISKEKWPEVKTVLEKVAFVNKRKITEKSMHSLMHPPPKTESGTTKNLIAIIMRSPVMLRRVCTTPVWWITTTFVYYGLSINSTNLSDTNMYLNFILTCAIEIPGNYTSLMVLDVIGRKATLGGGFVFSALCNIAYAFIPTNLVIFRLILFLMGKFGISVVFTALYLFTSELYPTEYRHSLLAFSSMIGRIGSITAPLSPVLNNYLEGLPSLLFGGMGMLAGILVFTQPETLGCKMPDTMAEAEALGSPQSKFNSKDS